MLLSLLHIPAGKIPVVPLNYTMISSGTRYDRETVEICIREVLQALSRMLSLGRDIEMDFNKVGRFVVHEKKAKMKFFKEFLNALVLSGSITKNFVSHISDICRYVSNSLLDQKYSLSSYWYSSTAAEAIISRFLCHELPLHSPIGHRRIASST